MNYNVQVTAEGGDIRTRRWGGAPGCFTYQGWHGGAKSEDKAVEAGVVRDEVGAIREENAGHAAVKDKLHDRVRGVVRVVEVVRGDKSRGLGRNYFHAGRTKANVMQLIHSVESQTFLITKPKKKIHIR